MSDRQKQEVKFLAWYETEREPYHLTFLIEHYPRVSLNKILPLVNTLELKDSHYIELWDHDDGCWTNITLTSEFTVENTQPTLLRVGKSLHGIVSPLACLGLSDHLSVQSHYPHDLKCSGEALVPPSKPKVPCSVFSASATNEHGNQPLAVPSPVTTLPITSTPSSTHSPPSALPTYAETQQGFLAATASPAPPPRALNRLMAKLPSRPVPESFPKTFLVDLFGKGMRDNATEMRKNPQRTKKNTYELVFNWKYVKSTAIKYESLWNSALSVLQDEFIDLGDAGTWTDFIWQLNNSAKRTGGM
ncbi:hypothetical protein V5O48_003667 [Marasmius crinis-equi]|uniref:Replication protein n=1 Tax=Marasmius crinis-equi TaxID=585013 RepID=A0ABR3FSH0_9AGAR